MDKVMNAERAGALFGDVSRGLRKFAEDSVRWMVGKIATTATQIDYKRTAPPIQPMPAAMPAAAVPHSRTRQLQLDLASRRATDTEMRTFEGRAEPWLR
jgi:hypothetical protein